MLSSQPSKLSNLAIDRSEIAAFLALNQEMFQILLAFARLSKQFKFAFAEINFPPDNDTLIAALSDHPHCQNIQFATIDLGDRDLQFLLSELTLAVARIDRLPDKKLVLILRGLEKSIGTTGDYPQVLTNLNYARDNFPTAVPHPTIFLLPDYAVTRFARFAPDFWAWTAATFKFQTAQTTLESAIDRVANDRDTYRTYAKPEREDRIDLLERLLQEYSADTEASRRARLEILTQLGSAYQSTRDFETAIDYFEQELELSHELGYKPGAASALHHLGEVYYNLRKFDAAGELLKQSLALKAEIGDRQNTAITYYLLGMVAQTLRKWDEARTNYQQALAICEEFGDCYAQAGTYHNLGMVAHALREWDEARANYQQALAIFAEFGDRYSQASTYYHLGWVAQDLREWDEALTNYQKALAIYAEFGDRYSQAKTYHQLGSLAFAVGEMAEAEQNWLQALQIWQEFGDEYSIQTFSIPRFTHIYQSTHSQELLAAVAQILGKSIAEIQELFSQREAE
jgi:tetratricopeptide (TPR) repeat protein